MGQQENRFIDGFYKRYPGRVAIGVAYSQDLREVFPIVIDDDRGNILGIVAMAAMTDAGMTSVHIFHFSVFHQQNGNGTQMLEILCREADRLNVVLSLSPIPTPNGEDPQISDRQLTDWYHRFGFRGETLLSRPPRKTPQAERSIPRSSKGRG